jgi:hypothetical protein
MAWVLPVLEGVTEVMSVVTFIQFIEEEAIQSAALGTYLALKAGVMPAVTKGMYRYDTIVTHLEAINSNLGWLAPYSKWVFQDFCEASRTNLAIFNDLIYARLAAKGGE